MSNKRKYIIFIIASLEGFGGTNRVATLLANGLSSYHDITILSRYSIGNTYSLNSAVKDIKFTGNNLFFLWQCKKYINDRKPDVVIIHTMSKLTPAILGVGVKAIAIWSIEHISYDFHSALYKNSRKNLYKKLNKVITLTQNDALHYKTFHSDVTVMANPTSLPLRSSTAIDTATSLKTIISIGRLTSQKGYDLLIKTWSLVESKHPDWSLHIYGEGEDKEKLEKLITHFNLQNITLQGSTNDVNSVYDTAEFYVMSSRYEGLPVVLIEAQSRGLPIVSFDCPSGPAEIISEGIDGYLVENGNVKMLAERIAYLIDNESMRQVFSANALISAKRFEPQQIINQWVTLIDDECKRND